MVKIKIKKLVSDAKIPSYAYPEDVAMDIFSCEKLIIKPKCRVLVKTGISMEFPKGYVALVWDKSGIAKNGVTCLGGVIDSNYRGEYKIILLNVGSKNYKIKKGQKVAQILIQPVVHGKIEEVNELDESSRGEDGFGSTGLF